MSVENEANPLAPPPTGYYQICIRAKGRYADHWQKVCLIDGQWQQVDIVNDAGESVELPQPHEGFLLTGQLYFAPGVLHDPSKPIPPLKAPAFPPEE